MSTNRADSAAGEAVSYPIDTTVVSVLRKRGRVNAHLREWFDTVKSHDVRHVDVHVVNPFAAAS